MWIRSLPNNYHERNSFCDKSVMLWRDKKVYVMDNHLSALWCWLQSCDPNKKYNFMHIDMHYDMLDSFYDEDLESLRNNPHMSYEDFKNLRRSIVNGEAYSFRWDNYIMAAYTLQPNWFHTNIFLTQKEGNIQGDWGHNSFHLYEENPLYMDRIINQYIGEPSKYLSGFEDDDYELPWIVNLDLDVFYTADTPRVQLFSDSYIRLVANILNQNMHNIQVLTIALSPDCVSGNLMKEKWSNTFHILKLLSEEIGYLKSFPFPK